MPAPYTPESTGFELAADYASIIKGKTILTTGVSPNGLGSRFVTTIAAGKPALLILAGRNLKKNQETADAITKEHPDVKTKLLQLDLGSFATVRKAAEEVNSWSDVPAIDVLVNNAGIMAVPYKLSPDGYESQFASNHLGHFLFTNLIMDKLLAAPAPRVISVTSAAHNLGWIRHADINFDKGETYDGWVAYGQSKTANMLFAISLAEKLGKRGLLAFSVHPGSIITELSGHLDLSSGGDADSMLAYCRKMGHKTGWMPIKMITQDQGVATHVFASFEPSIKDNNGAYLLQAKVADPYTDQYSPWAYSRVEADLLWKLSEKAVGQEFKY